MQYNVDVQKKYNILLVHNFYKQRGGEDIVFENEKEILINNGQNVFVYTRNNKEINKFNLLKKIILPLTTIFSFKTYFNVKKIIMKNHIDIIHVHNTLNLISPSIFYIAKKKKVPIVQTIHNFRMLCPNGLFYRNTHICEECPNHGLKCAIKHSCYRNSKIQTILNVLMMKFHRLTKIYKYVNYIFLTEFNKNKFIEYNKKLKIFDENKFFIKPNFVKRNALFNKIITKKKQFVYVGRLEEYKGIQLLVENWHRVNEYPLVICGTGPQEQYLQNMINEKKLNVIMMGFVEREELTDILKESTALIFPSKWYETFGMTIIESLAVNTPVIANNIGNASVLINDKNGMKYNSIDELMDIIKENKLTMRQVEINKCFYEAENYEILLNVYRKLAKRKDKK